MTSPFRRDEALERLGSERFDVLVVGGGITGAGVALDAAARGLRTALVERSDFASGTSSKSSKLVHGGLRYLQQRDVALVRESLAERRRLLANAPHLVTPLPFDVPLPGGGGVVARGYATALLAYDACGGWRIGHRHRRLDAGEILADLPFLAPGAAGEGFQYYDAFADDARLTLAVVRTAVLAHGAVAANHAPVEGLLTDAGERVHGVTLAGGTDVRAEVVVNAAGVWADAVDALHDPAHRHRLRPAKGVHLTLERRRLPCRTAAVLPVPGDKRSIFVVPWGERVVLGTTDTEHDGPLDDPACTTADVAYLLDAANAALAEPLAPADVVGIWAGLRPLLDRDGSTRTVDLSRRHRVSVAGNLVTVTGGKLTTYRRMAADTVDAAVGILGHGPRRSPTRSLPLWGASAPGDRLASRYGTEAADVEALVDADPTLGDPLVPGLPYTRAEAVFAARSEMALTLDDVLSRRTRARILDARASAAAAADVARLLAPELGWSEDRAREEAAAYAASVARERAAAGLSDVSGKRP
ncbi:MAG TPA: glycerol-3-phosphate dehydrogenase/oxidase [Acidimicrobiales bacterium]|nr:glycerol-3-phosphate dehydrogenase/oxidase [Acidimicrobiales bacterium]